MLLEAKIMVVFEDTQRLIKEVDERIQRKVSYIWESRI